MMELPVIQLERLKSLSGPEQTIGMLVAPGGFKCFTIERPWVNNAPYVSCIPEGLYLLKYGRYNRGDYDAYEFNKVRDRTLIKIHVANRAIDVLGCIGLGDSISRLNDDLAVLNSQDAFDRFMAVMDKAPKAYLSISWR